MRILGRPEKVRDIVNNKSIDRLFPMRAQERMRELGISASELARLLGHSSHEPVSQAFTADRPGLVSWDELIQYARLLGCTAEWLARGEGTAPPPPSSMPMDVQTFIGARPFVPGWGT